MRYAVKKNTPGWRLRELQANRIQTWQSFASTKKAIFDEEDIIYSPFWRGSRRGAESTLTGDYGLVAAAVAKILETAGQFRSAAGSDLYIFVLPRISKEWRYVAFEVKWIEGVSF